MTPESDGGQLPPAGATDPSGEPGGDGDGVPRRVGTFSLEGRAVPGVYVAAWIATILGGATVLVAFLAAGTFASRWLFLGGLLVLGVGLVAGAGAQAIERGRRPELAYRGPSPVLAFLAVVALAIVAIVVVLAPLSALGLDARSPLATTLSLALTAAMYVAVVRLVVVGTGALSWREMGVVRADGAAVRDLLVGAILAVPVLVVTLVLGGLLSRFVEPAPSPLPEAGSTLGLVANLVSAAILAPIGEELFFRGFATTAWARAVGIGPAIVRGALFFALAHVVTLFDASFADGAQRALFSFVALLPVGVALGWLFLARRSLYASIGLHAAFNGIQILILAAAAASV